MDLKRIFTRLMDSKREITVIDQCYSERAIVIHVGRDNVTVCDTPELFNILTELQDMAKEERMARNRAFARGDLDSVMRHGHLSKNMHACIADVAEKISIRTINIGDMVGFSLG